MRLKDKVIGMLVAPGYEDLEFWAVYMRVKEEGAHIKVMGLAAGENYASKSGGLTAFSEYGPGDLEADDLDALLIPGGWAPDKLRRIPEYITMIQKMNAKNKFVGFICHAGWLAASAEVVEGRKVTGSVGIKDDLVHAGATWVDEPAFVDGNFIWGRVVADIPDYNRILIETLSNL
ncbi:MAG: type 1 glutamine amidotransferase domain-containing protein [Spirochaetota bacterium]